MMVMKRNRTLQYLIIFGFAFLLTACSSFDRSNNHANMDTHMEMMSEDHFSGDNQVANESDSDLSLSLGDKIIENAFLRYETTNFDNAVDFVNDQVDAFDGMVEHTVREQTTDSYQYAGDYISMTIRVPNEQLHSFIDALNNHDQLYIQSQEIGRSDVTKTYRDNETRIAVLREEEETLREMLQEQGSLEEILQIRTRLSEIIMEREIFETENQNFDELIEFSTVDLSIQQTDRASTRDVSGFWDRLVHSLGDSFYSFISVMQQVMINVVYLFPYLVILLVIAGIFFLVWRKFRK